MEIQNVVDHLYATIKSGTELVTADGKLSWGAATKRFRLNGVITKNVKAAQLIEAEARRLNDEADKAPVLVGEEDGEGLIAEAAANHTDGPTDQDKVEELLAELRTTKNGDRKKVIRAKLRKLGYKLSAQK